MLKFTETKINTLSTNMGSAYNNYMASSLRLDSHSFSIVPVLGQKFKEQTLS